MSEPKRGGLTLPRNPGLELQRLMEQEGSATTLHGGEAVGSASS